jgi:NAD(P)-dependent dehydrogenase (short-subunit alcohol dehydrogenase family)
MNRPRRLALLALGGGAALLAATKRARSAPPYDFHDRVVVITGGSRGLGFLLAQRFATEGAQLALLARDEPTLNSAAERLRAQGTSVLTVSCDVGDQGALEAAIAQVVAHYGRLDVLVNNAGLIQVGPLAHMDRGDFARALDVHFWGAFHAINAALPALRQQEESRIVNIASVGGRLAVPHLAPYSASKFALVGLSDALRAELSRDKVRVTTVSPGLMRTGSPPNALFKGERSAEYRWFAIMDALPLTSIDAGRAADQIVAACRLGRPELTISWQARAATLANALCPSITARLVNGANALLPQPAADGDAAEPGWRNPDPLASSPLTTLSARATLENNEQVAARPDHPNAS